MHGPWAMDGQTMESMESLESMESMDSMASMELVAPMAPNGFFAEGQRLLGVTES